MKEATKRSIFRWIHIIYAFSIRYILLPVLLLSGLWMWKGHVVRRLLSKRSPNKTNGMKTGQELEA